MGILELTVLTVINLIFLLTGYYIGLNTASKENIKKTIRHKLKTKSHAVGVINNAIPDNELTDRAIDKGELNAMSKTLKKLIAKPLKLN